MLDPSRLSLFLAAALLLAVTPGPGILYVLSRSLAGGRKEGILSAAGTFIGGLAHVWAAAAGISALLAASALAFQAVKYCGAAYLVYLGINMIRTRGKDAENGVAVTPRGNPLRQGIVTEILNPKTALFFLSFIPQFVDAGRGRVFWQFVALGSASVTLNTLADIVVACAAGAIAKRLLSSVRARRRQRAATGGMMIALGAYVASTGD
jgi:threonine/homoserine/homoserine lactone efflux protein